MNDIITINPSTGSPLAEYRHLDNNEIDEKIKLSDKAFKQWSKIPISKRADLMMEAADVINTNKAEYSKLMALEMGKPLAQGLAEAEKCAWVCQFYAQNTEKFLKDQKVATEASSSYVTFNPLGVILAVMPWNFPFWQVFRFAAPTLMAGNTGVLKHAKNTMGSGISIEKIFLEAGFPEGIFTNLEISSGFVERVIDNPLIRGVSLTGSTPVGSQVASRAGRNIKKTVLELGGSDPYIILEDAPILETAETCAIARLINSGQSCIAAKRFIVVEEVYDHFCRVFRDQLASYKMGDPLDETVAVGPQARKDLQLTLQQQVDDSIKAGAKCVLAGQFPDSPGFFYPPTLLIDVQKGSPAYDDELFGPVAAVICAKNEQHAIEIANDSIFGLGAAVFTADSERGDRIARDELNAGCCFVNSYVKSDPRLPFGGIKQSGYGRELAEFGIHEFVNIKTVVVK
ncbi:MAG: NAD-dependent succinate-semialdehyde dehydrogenase [Candidatus Kapabacteria bacterium]|nr:NAD-dependent succinate-semialdehyde dehydrogenase [Candidatus Kapabacteria bacterium]